MKLIWLKGVKEPTAQMSQTMNGCCVEKINREVKLVLWKSWQTVLFQEDICLLALVAWSKGKLDRFNEGRYCKTDNRNIDTVVNCSAHQWVVLLDTLFSLKKIFIGKNVKNINFFFFILLHWFLYQLINLPEVNKGLHLAKCITRCQMCRTVIVVLISKLIFQICSL